MLASFSFIISWYTKRIWSQDHFLDHFFEIMTGRKKFISLDAKIHEIIFYASTKSRVNIVVFSSVFLPSMHFFIGSFLFSNNGVVIRAIIGDMTLYACQLFVLYCFYFYLRRFDITPLITSKKEKKNGWRHNKIKREKKLRKWAKSNDNRFFSVNKVEKKTSWKNFLKQHLFLNSKTFFKDIICFSYFGH